MALSTRAGMQRPRGLLWHVELRSLRLQPGVEFFDHLRRPFCIDLSWCVLSLPQHRVTPFINHVIHLGFVSQFFRQLRRDKRNSLRIADGYVSWHHGHISNSDGDVNSGEHDILQGRGIDAARVDLESRHLLNAGNVANCAVHDQAVVALRIDGGREIVSDDGSVADLPEKIDNQDIAGLKDVDDPGVFVTNSILFFAVGANHRVHVGTARHEHCRDHSAYQSWPGVNYFPPAFELVTEADRKSTRLNS